MKKVLSLTLVGALALSLTACGGNGSKDNSSAKKETTTAVKKEEKKEPLDLSGTWQTEPNDGSYMEAKIADGVISIDLVTDDGTRAIYWIGSYDAPTEYTNEYTWTSNNDHEQTDSALFASPDDTKEFNYKNGTLSFSASMQGVTKVLEMTKK